MTIEEEWPELREFQWNLLWKYSYQSLSREVCNVMLKLQPGPHFAQKLEEVYLLVSEIKFSAVDEKGVNQGDSASLGHPKLGQLIKLSKRAGYQCDLPEIFPLNLWARYDFPEVFVRVELVFLKRTLTIISEVKIPPMTFRKDMGTLLTFTTQDKNKNFTDITITCTGEGTPPVHFFAHKAILAARSPVFAKMFEHNLKESVTDSITIADINPDVVKELLTYIYTDMAPNIKAFTRLLLNAAEKYQMDRLKALCQQHLSYDLQVDNAAETLVLAQTHRAEELKKNALKYIVKHRHQVRDTKDWEKVHDRCELLEELLDTALELAETKQL